jgi:hypothetical protein
VHVQVLEATGGRARLVADPVPYLMTQTPPLDRNGIPMLIHMTFKNKDSFYRWLTALPASIRLAAVFGFGVGACSRPNRRRRP